MANILLILSLLLGLLTQWVFPGTRIVLASASTPIVSILLIFVGLQIGTDLGWMRNIRRYAFDVFLISASAIIGSLIAAGVFAYADPSLTWRETSLVASGLGFYSLSSIMLDHAGLSSLSVLSFLTNFLREFLSLVATPFIVQMFGALAPIAAAASAADSGSPIITRSSGNEYTIHCIGSAFVLSVAAPLLIQVFLSH